jgi:phosphatidylglycerol:prolipoprotein diacylglycerol transferase
VISYPNIDPVIFRIGPLAVRWYGVAYILGFASAYAILRQLAARGLLPIERERVGDLLSWLVAGLVLGARLGYVCFYNLPDYLANPLRVFAVWEGGMSFHGGLVGVAAASWLFARRRSISLLQVGDALALAAPVGLLFGRIANFVNGELYGRVTQAPWGMIFPGAGPLPRHPSQLYEAILEGPLLWAVVFAVWRYGPEREGSATAAFIATYGALRFLVEFVRAPDPQLGFVLGPLSMGQVLSAGMFVAGCGFLFAVWHSRA